MSGIEWTQKTWNPVTGCTKISQGCKYCYAEIMAKRLRAMSIPKYKNGFEVTVHPEAFSEPLHRKRSTLYFVCSMADPFHEKVPFSIVDHIMDIIVNTPRHTYLILTKRPHRMREFFSIGQMIPANAWLGTTIENQEAYVDRFDALEQIVHSQKFLSCEPLLEEIFFPINLWQSGIQWVIVGGESGTKARLMQKKWVQSLQKNCQIGNIPFFLKQWGKYGEDGISRSKKDNGAFLEGKLYRQVPKSLAPFFDRDLGLSI